MTLAVRFSNMREKERKEGILCTGASLYAPYSLLLISNKFWMGWGVGSQWGRSEGAELEGENKRGGAGWLISLFHLSGPSMVIKFLYSPAPPLPTVWALDLPRIHPVKVTKGLVCKKQPMHLCIMFWMCAYPLLGEVGGGWALDFSSFWASNDTCLSAPCHFTGPKYSRIPGPNPLPLPFVMDMHASKTFMHRAV